MPSTELDMQKPAVEEVGEAVNGNESNKTEEKSKECGLDVIESTKEAEADTTNKVVGEAKMVEMKDSSESGDKKEDGSGVEKESDVSIGSSLKNDKPGEADTSSNTNVYAYLDRDKFTSERFKIEVRGLPRIYGLSQLKDLLNAKLKLEAHKFKLIKPGSNFAFVCFANEAARERALKTLNNYFWKGRKLSASIAKACPDPLVRKRKQEEQEEGDDTKKKKDVPIEEALQESCTPLWSLPYDEQLKVKCKNLQTILSGLGNLVKDHNQHLVGWLKEQEEKFDGLPCELKEIRPSPVIDGYRNKCELTVGVNPENQEWTVGCRISSYRSGSVSVGPVETLKHMPQAMKVAAKLFQKFVCDSNKPPYDPETLGGYWRQLTVRTSDEGGLMLIVVCHPQDMKPEELLELKEKLKDFFEKGEGKEANVTSLYFQAFGRKIGNVSPPVEHVSGDKYIWETVKGFRFRISPEAFFQVNAAASEKLFDAIVDLCPSSGEDTALVDVCCGTGTIGLALSKSFGQVLGIEMVTQAVEDAKFNVTYNKAGNCNFFAGKAEDILGSVLKRVTKPNTLVVVDPPRAGLHPKTITLLRSSASVKKLVYVSCDLQGATRNIVDLCRATTKKFRGNPFVPVKAIPVDMFPHTPHCEIAILLERQEKLKEPAEEDNGSKVPDKNN